MRFLHIFHGANDGNDSGRGPQEAGHLEALRREGDEFLLAGEEAIRRALSRDSEQFLTATRQHGGQ